jgi:hypothetical protein
MPLMPIGLSLDGRGGSRRTFDATQEGYASAFGQELSFASPID